MNEITNVLSELCNEIKGLRSEVAALRATLDKTPDNTEKQGNIDAGNIDILKMEGIDNKISHILFNYKIPPHIKGYVFLREAIKMVYLDFQVLNGMTKVLYPTIAKKYNTTPARVERAIRHAIETHWYKTGHADLKLKPTNSEVIASIADKLRLENEEIAG